MQKTEVFHHHHHQYQHAYYSAAIAAVRSPDSPPNNIQALQSNNQVFCRYLLKQTLLLQFGNRKRFIFYKKLIKKSHRGFPSQ